MLRDSHAWDRTAIYFLQPSSDQNLSISRLIKESCPKSNLIALLLYGDASFRHQGSYDQVVVIKSYEELPEFLTIVPGGASTTEALLEIRDITLGQITMRHKALTVYDKCLFLEHCLVNALPTPITFRELKDIKKENFPIFYKQKYEQGGGTRGIAYTVNDIPSDEVESLIFQEYISSKGTFGVGFLADNGVLLVSFAHFEKESQPKSGGSAILIQSIDSERLIQLTKTAVSSLNYSGWGLAEFKYCDKRQDYVFMEINAKFWASCELAFRNKPEFMDMLFGIKKVKEDLHSLFYVNRCFERNIFLFFFLFKDWLKSKKIIYSGLWKSVIRGLLPGFCLRVVKSFKVGHRSYRAKEFKLHKG